MVQEWLALVIEPIKGLWAEITVMFPSIFAAVVLLLIGMILARVVRSGILKALKYANLDQHTDKIKLNELFARMGMGKSPSFILGFVGHWIVILVFMLSAANAVKLTVIAQVLQRFLLFVPQVLTAVLVVGAGMLIAKFLGEIVQNAATANKLQGAVGLAKTVKFVVILFAAAMALEQLGIDTSMMTSSTQIVLATFGLAIAIAFGLGGRDVAADIIRGFTTKRGNGRVHT